MLKFETNECLAVSPVSWLRRAVVASMVALGLAGCAGQGTGVEKWHMTNERAPSADAPPPGAPAQAVRAVLYREAGQSAKARQPINVYIDGHYQASLIGDVYTETVVCSGKMGLSVAFNDVNQRYATKLVSTRYAVGSGAVQYFRVSETAAGVASIEQLPADTARAAIGSLRLQQAHTISRVTSEACASK